MRQDNTGIASSAYFRATRFFLLLSFITGPVFPQFFSGSYQLQGVKIKYYDVVRDTTGSLAASDSAASYSINLSWTPPGVAIPMFTLPLEEFQPGDTVAATSSPDALMVPAGLAFAGINLSLTLDDVAGTMTIPAGGSGPSTYPTLATENCSTSQVLAQVSESATITSSAVPVIDPDARTVTWGLGIVESGVFPWIDTADVAQEDPSAYHDSVSWGMITAHYTNANMDMIDTLIVQWRAIDGDDAHIGIDENYVGDPKPLDRMLGVATVPGNTAVVAALALLNPDKNLNVGTSPIFIDPEIAAAMGLEASTAEANFGYLFDPAGDDEDLFSGDEPLQFTGYYFTYNFMVASGVFMDTLQNRMELLITYFVGQQLDIPTATVAGADSAADEAAQAALVAIGANAILAAGIGATIGAVVGDLVTIAGSPDTLEVAGQAILVQTLGAALQGGFNPDDSGHDFDGTNGRLIFEVDNVCIPEQQRQEVYAVFVNQELLNVKPDGPMVPTEFAVYVNYPNPFNPNTMITFDLPARLNTEVTVWNLLGQKVRTLHSGELRAGQHTLSFNGRDENGLPLPSGIYFYRVKAGHFVSTRKMMLLK